MTCWPFVLTVALLGPTDTTAQARPDIAGTWTMDEARSVSATQDAFVGPVVWTIAYTDKAVTVALQRGPKAYTLAFTLLATPPASPPDVVPSSRAYWDGDRLVTELAQNIRGQTVITREEWSLQPGGRELIVERLVMVEHGYSVRWGRTYNTAKDTFIRAVK